MKNLFFILLFSTTILSKASISAYFNHSAFFAPEKGPYIETYLSIMGNSVKYLKTKEKKYQGSVSVTILFKNGDKIEAGNKYNLLSPIYSDTTSIKENFIDQQRFLLSNGAYELELIIKDNNDPNGKEFSSKQPIEINFPDSAILFSTIQLLDSYSKSSINGPLTKNGYDLVPYVSNLYPQNSNQLSFYAELYHSNRLGENEKFIFNYFIESASTKSILTGFTGFSKQTASQVNPLLNTFSIESLPSGDYNLAIEAKNKNNELMATQKIFFQRINTSAQYSIEDIAAVNINNTFAVLITDKDSLVTYIKSLRPISNESEKKFIDNQLSKNDMKILQQFFYNFWEKRSKINPQESWLTYNEQVKKVQKLFHTQLKKGYETDRGRVFLQYGAPDQRTEVTSEPNVYPYEIWQYYRIETNNQIQTDKRFVFYNPDLVSNSYPLIFSDARGEIYDTSWQLKLKKRTVQVFNLDQENAGDHYGGNSQELFNNPR